MAGPCAAGLRAIRLHAAGAVYPGAFADAASFDGQWVGQSAAGADSDGAGRKAAPASRTLGGGVTGATRSRAKPAGGGAAKGTPGASGSRAASGGGSPREHRTAGDRTEDVSRPHHDGGLCGNRYRDPVADLTWSQKSVATHGCEEPVRGGPSVVEFSSGSGA